MKTEYKVIGVSIIFGLSYWVIDALLDFFIFYEGTLLDLMLFDVPSHEIYIRSTGVFLFIIAGVVMSRFVTQIRRGDRALQESEENLRTILFSIGAGLSLLDSETRIVWANQILQDWFGPLEKIKGKPCYELYDLKDPQNECSALRTLQSGQLERGESFAYDIHGQRKFFQLVTMPIKDDDGEIVQIVELTLDITERKQAEQILQDHSTQLEAMVEERTRELRDAQERMMRQERLAALGEMSGGVGHELRNPLGVITNAVYYLKTVMPDAEEKVQEYLDIISAEAFGAEKIVSDLLNFARIQPADQQASSVSDLVSRVLDKCIPPDNVEVTTHYDPDLPDLWVDPQQIMQVLSNLITNAYQAMPEGGGLAINAQANKNQVKISLADTGQGISAENMPKLFEPLYTTKTRGVGLGLAVCKNLIQANQGSIEVESIEGQGSTFSITLPFMEAAS